MGSPQDRAFEVVALAASFRHEQGRDWIVENFPPSVVELFDAVVARAEWASAVDLASAGLVVARVLDADADLAARYQADVDAGKLGFGAGEDADRDAAVETVGHELDMAQERIDRGPLRSMFPPTSAAPQLDTGIFLSDVDDLELLTTRLGGAPASPGQTEPETESISSWLNATLDRDSRELAVGVRAALSIFFGERDAASTASVRSIVMIPKSAESITLDVTVASSDFDVTEPTQKLVLRRDGTTEKPAVFGIVPRAVGLARLTIVVTVGGNFVQRIDITYDVGGSAEDVVRERGRPVAAAEVLQPRSASIHITREGDAYEVFAPGAAGQGTSAEPIPLKATTLDLAPRIEAVRAALLAAVKQDPVSLEMVIPKAYTDALLQKLAFAGYRLYQAVFEDNASPELRAVGDWLRGQVGQDEVTTVQIVSDGFPVPWPLMYLVDRWEPSALSWDNFLGMQCVVEQIPFAQLKAPPSPTIESQPQLSVNALLNETIDEEMPSKPITAQREYWTGRKVGFTAGTTRADLESVMTSDAASDVLYFFCHAETDDDDSDASELIMTGKEIITLGEIKAIAQERFPFAGHPLVFLNACESGELSPLFYSGFVPYFLNRGARGVIGTECRVPGLFASEWAKAFFDGLFSGDPLGKVVLDLRRRFLHDSNNPLGLLYVVHCDTDTVVSPALT